MAGSGCSAPPRPSVFAGKAEKEVSSPPPTTHPAPEIPPPEASPGSRRATVLEATRAYLGTPYRYGGEDRAGIDCSGLVLKVYAAAGIRLPRSCAAQYGEGTAIPRRQLAPGDLVFFGPPDAPPSHVGIYEGKGRFIHASTRHRKVRRDTLDQPWFRQHYRGARRLLAVP